MLGAIILPLRDYGVAGDAVGLGGVAAVEHIAGGEPPLDPPLVGIDHTRIARHRQDHVGCLDVAIGAAQPLREAELVADVAARRRRHRIERRLGVLGLVDDGDARLGDGRHVAAGAVGIAQPALGVLGIEAHVRARLVVGCGDEAAKRAHYLGFEVGAEGIVVPGLAHVSLRAGAVALRKQCLRIREMALGGERRVPGEEGAHHGGVAFLRPQHRFSPAAQEADAWPAWVGVDEADVAGGTRAVAVAAQDRPFDELARDRILDALLDIGRLRGAAATGSGNGILDGGHVDGGRARSGGPRHWFGRERLRRLGCPPGAAPPGAAPLGAARGQRPGRNRWRRHLQPRDGAAGAAPPISWRPPRPAVRRR